MKSPSKVNGYAPEYVVQNQEKLTEDSRSLLDVVVEYTYALDTLDRYDYQELKIEDTTGRELFHATYENAMEVIRELHEKFGGSNLWRDRSILGQYESRKKSADQAFCLKTAWLIISMLQFRFLRFDRKNRSILGQKPIPGAPRAQKRSILGRRIRDKSLDCGR